MFIIGADINTSIEECYEIVEKRDEKRLLETAVRQIELGANMLGINAGNRIKTEVDDIEWMLKVIQSKLNIPICFDSPNPKVFEVGLKKYNYDYGRPIVDSITGEKNRIVSILPLVAKYKVPVIGLLMNEKGYSEDPIQRAQIAEDILSATRQFSIPDKDVFLDPLVFPIAVNSQCGKIYLETVKLVKEKYPNVNIICGLDNISHGLPSRDLINSAFISMIAAYGQDCFLVRLNEIIKATFKTVDLLLGNDEFCGDFINAYRNKEFNIYS